MFQTGKFHFWTYPWTDQTILNLHTCTTQARLPLAVRVESPWNFDMFNRNRFQVLISVSAALPVSLEGGQVFNFRGSVETADFLGKVFKILSEVLGIKKPQQQKDHHHHQPEQVPKIARRRKPRRQARQPGMYAHP